MSKLIGKTDHQYITVIKRPYPGYSVVIPHPDRVGEHVRKNFFGVSQPQDEYLKAAIEWRDQTYFELYKRKIPKRIFHRKQTNSKTEIPGVRWVEKIVKKKLKDGSVAQYRVPCVIAEVWTKPGKNYKRTSGSKSKIYSISKYGEEEALRRAVEWRREMENILSANPAELLAQCDPKMPALD